MTESAAGPRVLVVANRTASTPRLLDEVSRRADEGASFTVLIPPEKAGHDGDDWTPEVARELLERAAHGEVGEAYPGGDAVDTIHKLIEERSSTSSSSRRRRSTSRAGSTTTCPIA